MDPASTSALFAGIGAMSAVVTAAIAGYTLLGARRDSQDRSRPVVVARMKSAPRGVHLGVTYLVVRNVGASVARDVRVTFDPPLPGSDPKSDDDKLMVLTTLARRYARPLPFLAPGEQLLNLLRNMTDDQDPLHESIDVAVTYLDDRGRRYADTFTLEREVYATGTGTQRGGSDYDQRRAIALEGVAFELWRGTD